MTTLHEYVSLFNTGRALQAGAVNGLIGRILRGKTAEDFETTTNDLERDAHGHPVLDAHGHVKPKRPLVLLVDANALGDVVGLSGNTYAMLSNVGYSPTDIDHYAKEGLDWKLVVFEDNGTSLATLATWDNVINLAQRLFPMTSMTIEAQRRALKDHNFRDIVRLSGESVWMPRASNEPGFMSPEALTRTSGSLVDVRRFFFDTLQLRELYRGDGWTYNSAGVRGVPEYVVPTTPLAGIGKYELIDLPPLRLPKHATGRASTGSELPVPNHFNARNASSWGYAANPAKLLDASAAWRKQHGIRGAAADKTKVGVLLIDLQGDFVFPEGTLYVGGRSGTGAIDDNVRIAEFLYRNLARIHQHHADHGHARAVPDLLAEFLARPERPAPRAVHGHLGGRHHRRQVPAEPHGRGHARRLADLADQPGAALCRRVAEGREVHAQGVDRALPPRRTGPRARRALSRRRVSSTATCAAPTTAPR